MYATKIGKCWDRDSQGNYILVERELHDWNTYIPEPEDAAEEAELDKFETELYGCPLDKGDIEVPKLNYQSNEVRHVGI